MNNQQYIAGVDGGGTKCKAVVFDENGEPAGEGISGPANVARIGKEALPAIIRSVLLALQNAGVAVNENDAAVLAKCHVSAGLAGATVKEAAELLNQWQHPFASFRFTSDLHTALVGAHGGENGAVLVAGTGSCAAALCGNDYIQYGGHGFNIGDKGSGAWFGREAVRHTLEALDGVLPVSLLSETVCAHFSADTTREFVNKLNYAQPAEFAGAAGLVFDCAANGDVYASDIVRSGTDYLSSIARLAMEKSQGKLVLAGGLAGTIRPFLPEDIRAKIIEAKYGPEWGAVHVHQD